MTDRNWSEDAEWVELTEGWDAEPGPDLQCGICGTDCPACGPDGSGDINECMCACS